MLQHSPPARGAARSQRQWRALWVAPLLDAALQPGPYRFEIESRDVLNVVTVAFGRVYAHIQRRTSSSAHLPSVTTSGADTCGHATRNRRPSDCKWVVQGENLSEHRFVCLADRARQIESRH
jgi:hypothetical protein